MSGSDENHSSLTAEDWRLVKEKFDKLAGLDQESIIREIERVSQTHPHIKAVLLEMLGSEQASLTQDLIPEQNPISIIVNQSRLEPGNVIGKYTIVKHIGEGGMGQVYLAQRNDDIHQQVAIKVINNLLKDNQAKLRFDTERRVLATLEHANIARLIDADSTDDHIYFVMEYVDGKPIDQYCELNQLGIEERLRLFLKVCDAVSTAHNNLIVHRDLKPENILVTEQGIVKLLDFGIAKPLQVLPGTKNINETLLGNKAFTPQYAAPEQINGGAITVSCDVYVLGLLLYRLLTDQHAFQLQDKTWGDIEEVINHQLPTLPSKISSQSSELMVDWKHKIKGDLDAIVIHSIKKEPEERYRSVQQLADEVNRFLNHEPLLIKSNQNLYRFRKFLRKNWLPVSAVGLIVTVISSSALLVWNQSKIIKSERDVAIRERQVSEEVTTFLVDTFKAADPTETMGTKITAKEILDQGVNKLAHQNLSNEVKNRLVYTLGKVYYNFSDYDAAESVLGQFNSETSEMGLMTDVQVKQIQIAFNRGEFEQLKTSLEIAYQNPNLKTSQLIDLKKIESSMFNAMDEKAEAEKVSNSVLKLIEKESSNTSVQYIEGLIFNTKIRHQVGNRSETLKGYQNALQLLAQHHPNEKILIADLSYKLASLYYRIGDYEKSLEYNNMGLEIFKEIYGDDHLQVSVSEHLLGYIKKSTGKYQEAIAHFNQSILIKKTYYGENSVRLATLYYSIGLVLSEKMHDYEKSLDYYETAFDLIEANNGNLKNLMIMKVEYSRVLIEIGRFNEARKLLFNLIDYFETKQRIAQRNLAVTQSYLAHLYIKESNYAEASKLLNKFLPIIKSSVPPNDEKLKLALKNKKLLENL